MHEIVVRDRPKRVQQLHDAISGVSCHHTPEKVHATHWSNRFYIGCHCIPSWGRLCAVHVAELQRRQDLPESGRIAASDGLAFDGASYWGVDGGDTYGTRVSQYDASGNFIAAYSPGIDFRSVFTDAAGHVFARQFDDNTIHSMTAPGVFAAAVSLTGGSLDAQSSVVLNGAGNAYIAMNGGVVSSWDLTGVYIGAVSLAGYGT